MEKMCKACAELKGVYGKECPDVQHRGLEAILRQTQIIAHIIGGRRLVKAIKWACTRCRIMNRV